MMKNKYKIVHTYGSRRFVFYTNDERQAQEKMFAIPYDASSTMYVLTDGRFKAVRSIKKKVI